MKKQISLLIALFCYLTSFAQYFEVGSGIGASYTKPLSGWPTKHIFSSTDRTIGGFSGQLQAISLTVNTGRYQFGAKLNSTSLCYYVSYQGTSYNRDEKFGKISIALAYGWPVKIFANRLYNLRKLQFYTGLSAGALNTEDTHRSSWCAGLQAGGTWWFVKHFGLNMDIAADYYHVHFWGDMPDGHTATNRNATALNFPITLGIHYRL